MDAYETLLKWYENVMRQYTEAELGVIIGSILSAALTLAINFLYLGRMMPGSEIPGIINVLATLLMVVPFFWVQYKHYTRKQEIESRFPDFMSAIVEGIQGGMSLPQAIKYASRDDFGALNPYVKLIVAQLSWGIPFEKVMYAFSEKADSRLIARSVSTIIETHKSGGNIMNVLDAVSKSALELEKIRNERESEVHGQMVTGYIIFFVFMGIMIGIQKFLLPALQWGSASQSDMMGGESDQLIEATKTEELIATYGRQFKHLSIIQGFFAGLSIGKLSQGSLSAGMRHAVILALIGYSVFTIL